MDATCTIQDSIHVLSLVHKYVSRILGTYHAESFLCSWYILVNAVVVEAGSPFLSEAQVGVVHCLKRVVP